MPTKPERKPFQSEKATLSTKKGANCMIMLSHSQMLLLSRTIQKRVSQTLPRQPHCRNMTWVVNDRRTLAPHVSTLSSSSPLVQMNNNSSNHNQPLAFQYNMFSTTNSAKNETIKNGHESSVELPSMCFFVCYHALLFLRQPDSAVGDMPHCDRVILAGLAGKVSHLLLHN